jgi:WD40 repeat protein
VFRIAPPPSSAFTPVVNFQSYYGDFLCCAFAPQGDVVAAGGEDDCISLFSITQRTIVARCVGHKAWVSSIRMLAPPPQLSSGLPSVDFFTAGHDGRIGFWRVQPQSLIIPRQRGRSLSLSSPQASHVAANDNAIIQPCQRSSVPVVRLPPIISNRFPQLSIPWTTGTALLLLSRT